METVHLQCGNCKKLMAIRIEHLGGQVHCPHCRSVVQTPASIKPPEPRPMAPAPNLDLDEHESVFSEQGSTDAVIGSSDEPRLEMPAPPRAETSFEAPPTSAPEMDLPKFKPRPVYDRSLLPVIGMIFLVPYALLTTAFLIYVIFFSSGRSADPFEYLRDPVPVPQKGGPKRIVYKEPNHDRPLAQHLRTRLGKPIQAGDLLITPSHIRLTADGDLQLLLRAKNTSTDTLFEPMNEAYMKFISDKVDEKPFTFLEPRSKERIYGMYLAYHNDKDGKDEMKGDAVLSPGGEVTIALTTYETFRKTQVPSIQNANEECLWRVRVRRGLVKVDRNDVSATMVIGVDFSSSEIERSDKKT
jgi:hypothetical protein